MWFHCFLVSVVERECVGVLDNSVSGELYFCQSPPHVENTLWAQ